MAKSVLALINAEVLKWARSYMQLDLVYVAEKTGFKEDTLELWEKGTSKPTIPQLRELADVYRFPIALFYLSTPPKLPAKRLRDRRCLPGHEDIGTHPELSYELRRAEDRRDICLELLNALGRSPSHNLNLSASVKGHSADLAMAIRAKLGVTYTEQSSWRDPRIGFNTWREKIEEQGVLVFQTKTVPLSVLRGYAIFEETLPIIGINRKDTYNARSFSLLHELTHILLRMSSLCDMSENYTALSGRDKDVEVFCNAVAGETLVPQEYFSREPELECACRLNDDGEIAVKELAKIYSVSREVIVRKMLEMSLVDQSFYQAKMSLYQKQYARNKKDSSGFVSPAVDAISLSGKQYIGVVLDGLNHGVITKSECSSFLGVKVKHFETLQSAFLL